MFHCGRNKFNTLNRYLKAMENRYGAPQNLEDFSRKAQAMNYEAMRPMFEAFAINKFNSTGLILWMLNSAWPELYWQLYDYYLMPNAAYYATKKACAPLQLMYNYYDHTVYLHNNTLQSNQDLQAQFRLYDFNSELKDERRIKTESAANSVKHLLRIDRSIVKGPVYFLDLRLKDIDGNLLASNFYWLPVQDDVLDYANSTWFVTPVKRFADLTALNQLPEVKVKLKITGSDEPFKRMIQLENVSSHIAFCFILNC